MGKTLRVALPGYNVETDTNLDHFSLYTDQDNVLIKEKARGSVSIAAGDTVSVAHNLGYVPLFLAYVNETSLSSTAWAFVGVGSILSSLYVASCDTSNLVITNFGSSTRTFKYFIFYDNQVGASSVVLQESAKVLKIAKQGYNVLTEKDPNNLIFHSDLNSFKIVYQGKHTVTVSGTGPTYQFAHNSPLSSTSAMLIFAQFPDGKVTLVGWYGSVAEAAYAYSNLQGSNSRTLGQVYFDTTNIYFNDGSVSVAYDITFVWYVFEASI